jgi:hypothetical protein
MQIPIGCSKPRNAPRYVWMGYEITNNHAFRMSLNSNVLIPLRIPVTERAYLLGHSVEINERYYSHMRTDSLTDIKEILNKSFTQQFNRFSGQQKTAGPVITGFAVT